MLLFLEGSDGCFLLLWEYDFYLINWTSSDVAPQIHKQIVNTICGSDKPHQYPVRSFTYRQSKSGQTRYKGRSFIPLNFARWISRKDCFIQHDFWSVAGIKVYTQSPLVADKARVGEFSLGHHRKNVLTNNSQLLYVVYLNISRYF